MLKKLFSHDMRALSRYMVPILCALMAIAVIACVALSIFWSHNGFEQMEDPFMLFFSASFAFVYLFLFLVYICVPISFCVVFILRVRSHMFGDEGYLTMTVPAAPHEHLLSKLFSGAVWGYITILCEIVAVFISLILPLFFSPGFFDSPGGDPVADPTAIATLTTLLQIFRFAVITPFSQIMLLLTTVTAGSLLGGRSHVPLSVAVYVGINMVSSLLQSILTDSLLSPVLDDAAYEVNELLYNGVVAIYEIAVFAALYLLTLRLLQKKVNLE